MHTQKREGSMHTRKIALYYISHKHQTRVVCIKRIFIRIASGAGEVLLFCFFFFFRHLCFAPSGKAGRGGGLMQLNWNDDEMLTMRWQWRFSRGGGGDEFTRAMNSPMSAASGQHMWRTFAQPSIRTTKQSQRRSESNPPPSTAALPQ